MPGNPCWEPGNPPPEPGNPCPAPGPPNRGTLLSEFIEVIELSIEAANGLPEGGGVMEVKVNGENDVLNKEKTFD